MWVSCLELFLLVKLRFVELGTSKALEALAFVFLLQLTRLEVCKGVHIML